MQRPKLLGMAILVASGMFAWWWVFSVVRPTTDLPPLAPIVPAAAMPEEDVLATSSPTVTFQDIQIDTATWKTYADTAMGYSFKYPPDWTAGGTSTIQNAGGNPGKSKYQTVTWLYDEMTSDGPAEYMAIYCCRAGITSDDLIKEVDPTGKGDFYKSTVGGTTILYFFNLDNPNLDTGYEFVVVGGLTFRIDSGGLDSDYQSLSPLSLNFAKSFRIQK